MMTNGDITKSQYLKDYSYEKLITFLILKRTEKLNELIAELAQLENMKSPD
ncbi:MAG: hypothetical protein Kow0098_03770 [Ignavibacteriaceae bacterium]